MLSGMNNVQVVAQMRSLSLVPVLMRTAKGDGTDRIMGLDLGADDYAPKPYTPRELASKDIALTSAMFSPIEVLMRGASEFMRKQQLSNECLGHPLRRFDRSLDVQMSGMRQKVSYHAKSTCRRGIPTSSLEGIFDATHFGMKT